MSSTRTPTTHPPEAVRSFFARSDFLDYMVLRPLSHYVFNWELAWDGRTDRYALEANSFAGDLNWLIDEIAKTPRPARYHEHEDAIVRKLDEADWPAQQPNGHWITADYPHVLERAAFRDLNQQNLITAAAGRVHAALDRGQSRFDDMGKSHLRILAAVMTIAIYHRDNDGSSLRYKEHAEDPSWRAALRMPRPARSL